MDWQPISQLPRDRRVWAVFAYPDGSFAAGYAEYCDGAFYDMNSIYIGDLDRAQFSHFCLLTRPPA